MNYSLNNMHIITPYNPWAPKKKKTWQEQMWEDQQIAELEAKVIAESQNRSLPDNAPAVSIAVAGPMVNAMAGGGGQPPPQFFNPTLETVAFTFSPTSGAGPLTIQFSNQTTSPQFDLYKWVFGDGTTSALVNPSHLYSNTGSYTVKLEVSNSLTSQPGGSTSQTISASIPSITAGFTKVSSSKTAPSIFTFTNTTVNTSQTPTTTYKWLFGSGSITSSLASPAPFTYTAPGGYTASLQATGSYSNLTSLYTQSFVLG